MESIEQNISDSKKKAVVKFMSEMALMKKSKRSIDKALLRKFNIKIK